MVGRPRKLGDKEYQEVEKLAQLGLTIEMIAHYLEINPSTAHRDKKFCKIYKKNLTKLGAKTRMELVKKMETDATANIYLDKVLNKTSEKFHDDRMELEREKLKIERERLELERKKIEQDINAEDKVFNALDKLEKALNE